METSTKEILVSPGFGAGWATFNDAYGKALAEDLQLVELVREGAHKGMTTGAELRRAGITEEGGAWPTDDESFPASFAFIRRAWEVCDRKEIPYFGGVKSLEIRTVSGPYRIEDNDGHESLVEAGDQMWW